VNAGIGLVDFVEKENAGDLAVFQLAQNELKLRHFLVVHLADHDGGVDRRQNCAHVVHELDRTRTIEEGVGVAHKVGGGSRQLDAHAVMPGFVACVADGVARLHVALARNNAGAREDGFKERGLAALKRPYKRDAAGTGRARGIVSICGHDCLPAPTRRSTADRVNPIVSGDGRLGQEARRLICTAAKLTARDANLIR
jgi:hypothetical protein